MTQGTHGNHAKASRQHRWSEEKMIADNGYVKLRVGKTHPLADPNGYAYEHLVVWCAAGRERPKRGETIHHKNDVKTDNRLDNLELKTRTDHNRLHMRERQRDPATGRLLPRVGKRRAGALLDGVEHKAFPA